MINGHALQKELTLIAHWRNQTIHTLRTHCNNDLNNQFKWVINLDAHTAKYYYIYNDGLFVGYCGLDKINNNNHSAEMSLLIGQKFQGKGYGHDAVNELFKIAFEILKLNRIHIEVYLTSDNWNFWESCGFKKEGVLRSAKYFEGNFYDSIVGSILKTEWEVKNGKNKIND